MKYGDFELLLQVSSARGKYRSLDEKIIGRKHYAIAEPNDEYIVKVVIHRGSGGNFVANKIIASLYLDGIRRYSRLVDTTKILESECVIDIVFNGIRISENKVQAFKFSPPNVASGDTSVSTNEEAGSVRVEIYEAILGVGEHSNKTITYQGLQAGRVPQDSKFFKCPSVTTTGGQIRESKQSTTKLPPWKFATKLASIEMYYHTKDVVDFLLANHCSNRSNHLGGRKRQATIDEEVEVDNPNDDSTSEVKEQEGDECDKHVPTVKKIPMFDLSVEKRPRTSFIYK